MPIVIGGGEDVVGLQITTGPAAASGLDGFGWRDETSGGENARHCCPLARRRPRGDGECDGTFQLDGLLGVYTMRFESLPTGWMIKSITANGVDVSDSAMEFRPADRMSMRVELTDRITQVTGTVRSDRLSQRRDCGDLSRRAVQSGRARRDSSRPRGRPKAASSLSAACRRTSDTWQWPSTTSSPVRPQTAEFLQRAKKAASVGFGLSAGDQRILELPLLIR